VIGLVASGVVLVALGVGLIAVGETLLGLSILGFPLMLVVVILAQSVPDRSGPRLEDGALVVRAGRVRQALLVLAGLLFVATGALMLLTGYILVQILGGLAVVTFGTFTLIGLWRLRGPWRLVLTGAALRWDHGFRGSSVAWDEMTEVRLVEVSGSPLLAIDVRHPAGLRTDPFSAWFERLNRSVGGGDVNVPLGQLSVDNETLLSLVTICSREPEARSSVATEATLRRLQA
jgi:hypothetical protein